MDLYFTPAHCPIEGHRTNKALVLLGAAALLCGFFAGWNAGQGHQTSLRMQPASAAVGSAQVPYQVSTTRRHAIAGVVAGGMLPLAKRAEAAYGSASGAGGTAQVEPVQFQQFYGAANPPATYGGVGGTTRDLARYGYQINAATWKEVAVGKVDKGIGGIDSKWEGPGKKVAFCVTVTRAGEDNVGYTSGGKPEEIIKSMAGAEPNLQDALQTGTLTYKNVERNGVPFIDFDVAGPSNHYLVTVGVKKGRLFAFYVTAPERVFQQDKATLQKTLDSFEVY